MALIWCSSVVGDDAQDATTKIFADSSVNGVSGAIIDSVAGDSILLDSTHSEIYSAATTFNFPGSVNSRTKIQSINWTTEQGERAGAAQIGTASGYDMTIDGSVSLFDAWVQPGRNFTVSNQNQYFRLERSTLQFVGTNPRWHTGNNSGRNGVELVDVALFCGVGTSSFFYPRNVASLIMRGGSITKDAGSSSLWSSSTSMSCIEYWSVDMTACGCSFLHPVGSESRVKAIYCDTPAGMTLINSPPTHPGARYTMIGCGPTGATHYNVNDQLFGGAIYDEDTVVRTGGSDHLGTPVSLRFVTNTDAGEDYAVENDVELIGVVKFDAAGTYVITGQFIHDSQIDLTSDDVELVVKAPFGATSPGYSFNALKTLSASAESWDETGLINPNKQQITGSVVVAQAGIGYVYWRLKKTSYTAYFDNRFLVAEL